MEERCLRFTLPGPSVGPSRLGFELISPNDKWIVSYFGDLRQAMAKSRMVSVV